MGSSWAAVPLELPMQGVIYDNAGSAASGTFEVTFALYPSQDASPAQAVWWETTEVEVNDGVFVTRLGLETPLDAADFASGTTLWLGMAVESDPELPRRPLAVVELAQHVAQQKRHRPFFADRAASIRCFSLRQQLLLQLLQRVPAAVLCPLNLLACSMPLCCWPEGLLTFISV